MGRGPVGLDTGPSTVAVVAPEAEVAFLSIFCRELDRRAVEIQRLQRRVSRSYRLHNPQNYTSKGAVKKGAKVWNRSKSLLKLEGRLADLQRAQAEHRKSLHGKMANDFLKMGSDFKIEKVSYKAFQKLWGRSVSFRAPSMFVSLLKRKAESAGGSVEEFSTYKTKLSQTCICGRQEKKKLSERWHRCECGVEAQRDLFSAFLASFVQDGDLMADQALHAWQGTEQTLAAAIREVQTTTAGPLPQSFGLGQSRSRSPRSVPRTQIKAVYCSNRPKVARAIHGETVGGDGFPLL